MGEAVKKLFAGDHTRKIKKAAGDGSAKGSIMKFAVKKKTCLGCKVVLSPHENTVCSNCEPKRAELYLKQVDKVRKHEELYSKVWTQCQRCQGSLHLDVLCASRDCPIFYRRRKVQKDLKESQNKLDSFSF